MSTETAKRNRIHHYAADFEAKQLPRPAYTFSEEVRAHAARIAVLSDSHLNNASRVSLEAMFDSFQTSHSPTDFQTKADLANAVRKSQEAVARDVTRAQAALYTSVEYKLAAIHNRLYNWLLTAEDTLEKFAEELVGDPAYALSWGERAFFAAGMQTQAIVCLRMLPDAATASMEDVVKFAGAVQSRFLRLAGDVPSSTSHTSNLMAHAHRKALADIYEFVNGAL